MDEARTRSYLASVLRKLLTLIALCAGLVAVGEPARAAAGQVESVLVERAVSACVSRAEQQVRVAEQRGQWRELRRLSAPKPVTLAMVPTVRLQVDRARE